MNEPIALVISDLHLSLLQPACRADKDWMEVQKKYLAQVRMIADHSSISGPLPVLCAGDIFDRWNPPPELINFALRELPDGMICVPGQHDLPNHRMDQIHRSGYGVLVQAKKIKDIAGQILKAAKIHIYGFGWNQDITLPKYIPGNGLLNIALIHHYCWAIGHQYPGAPEDSHLNAFMKQLKGYDVAVFGDNHKSFLQELK